MMDILVFAAHPDDCEIGMGGTIRKLANYNYKILIVDLTRGEMSSNGNIFKRQKESDIASKLLGVSSRINMEFPDRGITSSKRSIEKCAEVIRRYKPRVVFYPSSEDMHPDHVAASLLIRESIFHAKLSKFISGHEPHLVLNTFEYNINNDAGNDFYVDITETFKEKMKALSAYESQFIANLGSTKTRLTNSYMDYIEARDRVNGYSSGTKYAEGFKRNRAHLICSRESWEGMLNG